MNNRQLSPTGKQTCVVGLLDQLLWLISCLWFFIVQESLVHTAHSSGYLGWLVTTSILASVCFHIFSLVSFWSFSEWLLGWQTVFWAVVTQQIYFLVLWVFLFSVWMISTSVHISIWQRFAELEVTCLYFFLCKSEFRHWSHLNWLQGEMNSRRTLPKSTLISVETLFVSVSVCECVHVQFPGLS